MRLLFHGNKSPQPPIFKGRLERVPLPVRKSLFRKEPALSLPKGGFRGISQGILLYSSWRAIFIVAALLLVGLGCSTPTSPSSPTATTQVPEGGEVAQWPPRNESGFSAILVTSDLAVGTNRVSFGIVNLDNMPVRTPEAQVQAVYFPPGDDQGQVRQTAAAEFVEWPPPGQRGVYVTTLNFDTPGEGTTEQPGLWFLRITTATSDGTEVEAQTAVRVREEPSTPGIGEPAPRSDTPTAQDVDDLSKISTASPPDPDLYQMSIADALDAGKPLVVVFATPAFCVSATCGPQVEMVSQVKERHKEEANFIHVEVFQDPHLIEGTRPTGNLAPAVEEWGLLSEPWTFIIDKEGRVHAKFEQFTPAEEIEKALQEVL